MSERIYLDSCAFLAWLKHEDGRIDTMDAVFEGARFEKLQIITSTLTIAEVLNIQGARSPITPEDRGVVRALFNEKWIVLQSVTRRIAEMAQDLVWEYGIKPKDAIHVATGLFAAVPNLYSYDSRLKKHGFLETSYGSIAISEPLPPLQGSLTL